MPSKDLLSGGDYLTAYEFSPNNLISENYTFREGFNRLDGYIYPYLENTDVNTTTNFEYPFY